MSEYTKEEWATALTEFIERKKGTKDGLVCTVTSYDSTTKTCYCEPINEDFADIQQVKVCPDTGTGLFIQPKVGSVVLVSFMSDSSAYISMYSTFDAMKIGGDQYHGLAKTEELKVKLNNLENKVNAILAMFGSWVVVPNDGGAALKALYTAGAGTTLSALTLTARANIENTVIKHGNGTT